MPDSENAGRAELVGRSRTVTEAAPASRQSRVRAAMTRGLVVTAYSGARPVSTLGLSTTLAPRLTNLSVPPRASSARRTFSPGSEPWMTTRSGPGRRVTPVVASVVVAEVAPPVPGTVEDVPVVAGESAICLRVAVLWPVDQSRRRPQPVVQG